MEQTLFKSTDGTRLCGVWETPSNKTDKAIVLAHGLTVDKDEDGVFTELSKHLCESGFAVFRFDFRGHGESEGESINMTINGEVGDLKNAVAEVLSKRFYQIGLLGASFGGSIATIYASRWQTKLKCMCLWNPVLNYNHTFLNPTLPWIRNRKDHMKKEIEEKGWTTLGGAKFRLGRPLFEEMAELYPYEALRKIKIPTVIIHGTRDSKVPFNDSKEYVSFLPFGELITIDGAEHGFHEAGETGRAIDETIIFFRNNL